HQTLGVERGIAVAAAGAAEGDAQAFGAGAPERLRELVDILRGAVAARGADGAAEAVEHSPRRVGTKRGEGGCGLLQQRGRHQIFSLRNTTDGIARMTVATSAQRLGTNPDALVPFRAMARHWRAASSAEMADGSFMPAVIGVLTKPGLAVATFT